MTPPGPTWAANRGNTATSYTHTGLTAESTRHYRVSAINSVGTGQPSNTANATTSQATQGSPDLVVDNTISGTNVPPGYNLSLNANVRNKGDGPSVPTTLRYYHSPDVMITSSDTQVGTDRVDRLVPSGSIRHANGVTVPSTPGTYYYGACVDTVPSESDAGNNCSTATEVTVRVVNSPPEVTGDIDDVTATLGGSFQVDISGVFTEPDGEKIQNYGFTLRTSGILSGTVHTQTGILNLRAIGVGATTVAVEASDIHGNGSGPHDLFMVTVVPAETTAAPGAPTGLTATGDGQTEIDLLWTAPSDDGGEDITGYKIEVSTDGSSWSDLVANTNSTSTSYSHTGLTADSARHYRVSAINSAGAGPASNTANATTNSPAAAVPGASTGLTATADGETQIDLSWSAPSSNGGADITGYRIEVSTDGSSWTDLVANTGDTTTNYTHTGLTADSTRHYRVSAINSAGTGPASDSANSTTDSHQDTSTCASGSAISDAANNPRLVSNCEALLAARDTLRGTGTLNWSADTPIGNWDGIIVGGTPQRVTELSLQNQGMTGTVPAVLGELSGLEILNLGDNKHLSGLYQQPWATLPTFSNYFFTTIS